MLGGLKLVLSEVTCQIFQMSRESILQMAQSAVGFDRRRRSKVCPETGLGNILVLQHTYLLKSGEEFC